MMTKLKYRLLLTTGLVAGALVGVAATLDDGVGLQVVLGALGALTGLAIAQRIRTLLLRPKIGPAEDDAMQPPWRPPGRDDWWDDYRFPIAGDLDSVARGMTGSSPDLTNLGQTDRR